MDAATRRRLHGLVAAVVLAGVVLQAGVGVAVHHRGPVVVLADPPWYATGPSLLVLLLGLAVLADLYAVRVRHGEEAEELSLAEAAVVVCALLLPPVQAMLLPVAASALCSLVRRRGAVKLLFNSGTFAVGSALVVAALHAVATTSSGVAPVSITECGAATP